MSGIKERQRQTEHGERPRLKIPRLTDLREVLDKKIVDNLAVLWKMEVGEAGINTGTYVALPLPDQGLILVFHQSARSFVRRGKVSEHRHWKYDSFIGKVPDARSTNEERWKFNDRIAKVKRSPDFIIPAGQINGRVTADIRSMFSQKAG